MKEYGLKFQQYLRNRVSKNTYDSYTRDVKQFIAFLEEKGVEDPTNISDGFINLFVERLKESQKSNATVVRKIASIRCFYNYLVSTGQAQVSPVKKSLHLVLDKQAKKYPQILTGSEIELLLSLPDVKKIKGCRDKAMLELLYATGIRVSELIELDIEDINLQLCTLYCNRKGKSERIIPVHAAAVSAVSDYVSRVRSKMIVPEGGQALFINLNGRRLTRQGFWKIVKFYSQQAHISKKITPQTLRHSFALHLLENGADLKDIQKMLGHADISSTQVYVHLLNDHFREVYNQCHPRAKLN